QRRPVFAAYPPPRPPIRPAVWQLLVCGLVNADKMLSSKISRWVRLWMPGISANGFAGPGSKASVAVHGTGSRSALNGDYLMFESRGLFASYDNALSAAPVAQRAFPSCRWRRH